MAELFVQQAGSETSYQLKDSVTVGRADSCNVKLDDSYVSKVHSIISKRPDGFYIRDLKSANKTRINGAVIDEDVRLHDGDEIIFGTTRARFVDVDAPVEVAPVEVAPVGAAPVKAAEPAPLSTNTGFETRFIVSKDQFLPEKLVQDQNQLRGDYEKLRVSHELSNALAGQLNIDTLLQRALDTLIKLFRADRGVVVLREADGQLLPRCGRDKTGQNRDVPFSNTIVSEAVQTRSSMLSFDAAIDARFKAAESVLAQGIRSSMAAPLLRGDEVLGVIVLDSQLQAGVFLEKDLRILQTAANQAAVAIHNSMLAQRLADEAVVRQRFQKLLAPNLVDKIIDGSLSVERTGELRDVTVFNSDIRGFTSFSEQNTPELVVSLLNDYFEDMVEIVFANEGTLDKFMGDGIMALFGAPVSAGDDDAVRAVRTAVEMQQAIERFNVRLKARGEEPFKVGIGVESGGVVAGFIGSQKALEYTVIGDIANTSARLCGEAAGGEILIGLTTYERVHEQFDVVEKEPVRVKNKAQPVRVFSVRW